MKKILLTLAVSLICIYSFAQVLSKENELKKSEIKIDIINENTEEKAPIAEKV